MKMARVKKKRKNQRTHMALAKSLGRVRILENRQKRLESFPKKICPEQDWGPLLRGERGFFAACLWTCLKGWQGFFPRRGGLDGKKKSFDSG